MTWQRDLFGEPPGADRSLKPDNVRKGRPFDVLLRAIDHPRQGEPREILRRSDTLTLDTGAPIATYDAAIGRQMNLVPGGTRYEVVPMPSPDDAVIYVDPLFTWPGKTTGQTARHFGNGKQSCHLYVAGPILALHLFAHRLGMQTPLTHARHWLHNLPDFPHYDLIPSKRARAVALGAHEVTVKEARDAREIAKGLAGLILFAQGEARADARRAATLVDPMARCDHCGKVYRVHVPDPFERAVRVLCGGKSVRLG